MAPAVMSRGALERRIAELALQRDLYHRLYEKERADLVLVREWGAAHYQEALALRAELKTPQRKGPNDMQTIQVTFIVEVDDDATDEQLERMVDNASVQFEDPVDDEGERATFSTGKCAVDWFRVRGDTRA